MWQRPLYDTEKLWRSLRVTVERPSRTIARIHLRPFEVGHAVPTGDLLRRLEVALALAGQGGRRQVLDRRWLGRRFATRPNGIRDEVTDDRVGPGGTTVELRIPEHLVASAELRWRVMHQRVAHGSDDPRNAVVDGELEIASGIIPAYEGT